MATATITTSVSLATANKIRINLFLESAPSAVIQYKEDNWKTQNEFAFDQLLPSTLYRYGIFEYTSQGVQLQQYGSYVIFTTPSSGSVSKTDPFNIIANQTLGVISGMSSVVFDGNNGLPDLRGWDITIFEIGSGPMERGVTYSYDVTTATFSFLGGRVFTPLERFYIEPRDKIVPSTGVITRSLWSGIFKINGDTVLTADQIGQKCLIIGNVTFLNITLPEISTVPEGVILYLESTGGNHVSFTVTSANAGAIDWLEGSRTSLYGRPNEMLQIYRYGNTWRVHSYEGNFKLVGKCFLSWQMSGKIPNCSLLDGSILNVREQPALYYDHILKMPPEYVLDYNQWNVDNMLTRFKYTRANASGNYRIPDVRGYMTVSTKSMGEQPGNFFEDQMIDAHVRLFTEVAPGNINPTGSTPVAWSSSRRNGNQDYDVKAGQGIPTLGISSGLIDVNGNPLRSGDTIEVNRYTSNLFVYF